MLWNDEGIIVNVVPYKDYDAIVTLFTKERGLHTSFLHRAFSKKNIPLKEIGTWVDVVWQSKDETSMGFYQLSPKKYFGGYAIGNLVKTSCLLALCNLIYDFLIGGDPYTSLYNDTIEAINNILYKDNPLYYYVVWEVNFLTYLGFGLDLSRCAISGARENLFYISPNSGRAASFEAGGVWRDKLFVIPECFRGYSDSKDDIYKGLVISKHFLNKVSHKGLPNSRLLIETLANKGR